MQKNSKNRTIFVIPFCPPFALHLRRVFPLWAALFSLCVGPPQNCTAQVGGGGGFCRKNRCWGRWTFFDLFRHLLTFVQFVSCFFLGGTAQILEKKVLSVGRWVVVGPSFFRVHLFVTTRVAIKDENFLIGAIFGSDRSRLHVFRPTKSVLGPVDVFRPFSTLFDLFSILCVFLFWGDCANPGKKKCSPSAAG